MGYFKHNVSEAVSVPIIRRKEGNIPVRFVPLGRASLYRWTYSRLALLTDPPELEHLLPCA
jgi:hypothetical protein